MLEFKHAKAILKWIYHYYLKANKICSSHLNERMKLKVTCVLSELKAQLVPTLFVFFIALFWAWHLCKPLGASQGHNVMWLY